MAAEHDAETPEVSELIRRAIELIQAARETGSREVNARRASYQANELYRANANSSRQVEAALYSAVIDLKAEAPDLMAAAFNDDSSGRAARELIRVAYNRARRKHRRDDRLGAQANLGEGVPKEGSERALDRQAGSASENPEIRAQLVELIGYLNEGLNVREQQMLAMIAAGHSQTDVAEQMGCSHSTVSRVLTRVRHRFDRLLIED